MPADASVTDAGAVAAGVDALLVAEVVAPVETSSSSSSSSSDDSPGSDQYLNVIFFGTESRIKVKRS